MRARGYPWVAAFGLLVFCASVGRTQQQDDFGTPSAPLDEDISPERKHPSIFRRPAMDTPAKQLEYASRLAAEGETREAAKQFRNAVHAWHETPEAVQAQIAYARLLETRGKLRKAFVEYQYLVDRFPGRFPYDEVLDRQMRIANAVASERHWEFLLLPGFDAPERAIPLLKQIVKNAPRWERVPEIQYRIAALHDELGEDEQAIEAYGLLASRYRNSELAPDAAFARAQCIHRLAVRRGRDEKPLRDALEAFQLFLHDYATHDRAPLARERVAELRGRLADMAFARAVFYERKNGTSDAARIAYTRFLDEFPDGPQAAAARVRLDRLTPKKESNP
jgi:tetratricopeptide (TPR) repeat protein